MIVKEPIIVKYFVFLIQESGRQIVLCYFGKIVAVSVFAALIPVFLEKGFLNVLVDHS